MLLSIDTSDNKKTIVKLNQKTIINQYSSPCSQKLLLVINQLLKQEHKTLKDLTAIKVNLGPGSFTSLRVGVSVANALSFALNIPVNNQKPPVIPQYGVPPNITLK